MKRNLSNLIEDAGAFRQQVRMAAVQVAGLKPDELAQALAYELEPFSGIPANEADVIYHPIVDPDPTVRVYDVAVKRRKRGHDANGRLERTLKITSIVACLLLVGLLADGIVLASRNSSCEKALAQRRPLQAQLNQLRRESEKLRADTQAIRTRREAAAKAQRDAATRRASHAALYTELAAACGDRAVISAVTPAEQPPHALHIRATGASATAAAEVMRLITPRVAALGWSLTPGTIAASDTGSTVTFEFEIAPGQPTE